jgi:sugar lactone lactonase YvrE
MKTNFGFVLCAAGFTCVALAGDTLYWSQSDYADFQKGVRTNLSIRSDGRLSLAPRKTEVADSSTAYLWALARDSRGTLYTGGGPGAKLFRISPAGKSEKFADFDALEIQAIAVDSQDRVYVATAPDGRVYRVDSAGKTSVFYDPKQKYIWAMVFDKSGDLFIATGDQGEIHKVTPDGQGQVFFKSDETHMRSLAFDREGNLIAGTEPGGLVIRISAKGDGFVVYQMPKREVTALAVGPDNEIYAAAVGSKTGPRVLSAAPVPQPAPAPMAATAAAPGAIPVLSAAPAAAIATAPATVPGGSDVYLIPSLDNATRVWTSAQDVVYSLALDSSQRLLIATGNRGSLYRLEEHSLYTTLVTFPAEQVTALLSGKDGALFAATGNVGKVFRVGPGIEQEGTIESDVFDSGGFTMWGRVQPGGELNGGRIAVSARSGNLDRPQKNWSEWSAPVTSMEGARTSTPAARFLQWKATLTAGAAAGSNNDKSPWLDSVDVAYLRRNVAPKIEQIDITPYNYRFPAPATQLTLSSAATLTLPAIGAKQAPSRIGADSSTYPGMTYQKGAIGVRWTSSDENGDSLVYSVEIRGAGEKTWKPLRDKLHEKYYSFDSTAFPDGEYRFRITASDAPSNVPEDALKGSEESDTFTIDNTPPVITLLQVNGSSVRWHAADALSTIYQAEYSIDGGDWMVADPVGKLSDSKALDYSVAVKGLVPGEHVIAVRVSDQNDNMAVEKAVIR